MRVRLPLPVGSDQKTMKEGSFSVRSAVLKRRRPAMTEPIQDEPNEAAHEEEKLKVPLQEPILSRPRWRPNYWWILFLAVAFVLALGFYVGWDIITFWQRVVNRILGFE
jgi:hypothetical protein